MLPVRPRASERGIRLGWKERSRAVARTRSRVSGRTASGREKTRDTVALDTPAWAATSAIVVTVGLSSGDRTGRRSGRAAQRTTVRLAGRVASACGAHRAYACRNAMNGAAAIVSYRRVTVTLARGAAPWSCVE